MTKTRIAFLLSESTESTAAAGVVASSAGDLVVDLAIGELVELAVVLVAKAGLVGQVVDLCKVVMLACALCRNGTATQRLTSVSLAGHALLDAGLLLSTLSVTAATAAALAQDILGFVQKVGHVCGVCEVSFVVFCFRCDEDWMERNESYAEAGTELCYMPWSYVLEFVACVIPPSLTTLATSLQLCELCYWVCVVTVGQATSIVLVGKLDVAGFWRGR